MANQTYPATFKKLIFILPFLTMLANYCFGQRTENCDEILIYQLVNTQVKIVDKFFDKNYFIDAETFAFDSKQNPCDLPDSIYCNCCEQLTTWNKDKIKSEKATVAFRNSLKHMDYSCFIGMPKFNKSKTKCKITVSTHQGEWGGHGEVYYYLYRRGKWKFTKSRVSWVS